MDIKRIKQLAGLAPLTKIFEDRDFERLPDMDDDDEGRDYGSDKLGGTEEKDFDEKDIGDDVDDDLDTPGDEARKAQGSSSKNIAAAIAALRSGSKGSDVPELGDDVDAEAGDVETGDLPATDEVGEVPPDVPTPETPSPAEGGAEDVPPPTDEVGGGVGEPPMAAGGEAASSTMARGERRARARDFLTKFPKATRKEFMTYCAGLGIGGHYANQMYYTVKKSLAAPVGAPAVEYYLVVNPANGKVLAEHTTYDTPIWTPFDKVGMFEPNVMTQIQAKKAVDSLARHGIKAVVQKLSINESEEPTNHVNKLIGKQVMVKTLLSQRTGILEKIEDGRVYCTGSNGEKWSAPLSNLKG